MVKLFVMMLLLIIKCTYNNSSASVDELKTRDVVDVMPSVPGMNFAADDTDGKRLFRDLFITYLMAERPVKNTSTPVVVTMDPLIVNLLAIEEVNEAVTANFWMAQYWYDEHLTWNPENYGGRKEIHVPQQMIWLPDIVIYNNLRLVEHIKEESLYAKVNASGHVSYYFPAIYETSCDLNIKYFPFDEQNCSLKFGSWSFHGFAVDLMRLREKPPMQHYKDNPEWNLVDAIVMRHNILYTCCPEPYPDVTISFHLRRKPQFYVITLIFPAAVVTTVAIIGLFSPSHASGQREEKVTMGMTTLLAMSVLIMMVSDLLPRTSKVVPVIDKSHFFKRTESVSLSSSFYCACCSLSGHESIFYMFQLFLCALGTVVSVAIMNLEKEGHYGNKAPEWLKHVFIEVLPFYLGMNCYKNDNHQEVFNPNWMMQHEPILPDRYLKKIVESEPNRATLMLHIEAEILRSLKEMHERSSRNDQRHLTINHWHRICHCIDRLCMAVFLLIFAFGSLIIFMAL